MSISYGGAQSYYAFITPVIESKKIRTVRSEHVLQILASPGIKEALTKITNTDLGSYLNQNFHEGITTKELEWCLWQFLAIELQYLYRELPRRSREIVNQYISKYDIMNLKTVLRRISFNTFEKPTGIPLGSIYLKGRLDDLLKCEAKEEVGHLLDSVSMNKYAEIVRSGKERIALETTLEAEYFSSLMKATIRLGDRSTSHFVGTLLDMNNVLLIVRSIIRKKKVTLLELLPGSYRFSSRELELCCRCDTLDEFLKALSKTCYFELAARLHDSHELDNDPALIEIIVGQYVNSVAKEVFLSSVFTAGYFLAYILMKENEVKLLTTALKIVEERTPSDRYTEYLIGEKI